MRRNEPPTLASSLVSADADVQRFIENALDEIQWLRSRLTAAERSAVVSHPKGPVSPDRSAPKHDLVLEQLTEISELRACLDRVQALCDLTEWAAKSTGSTRPTVQVSDLRKAMKPDNWRRAPSGDF
jgi:hypothetical protein